VKCLGELLDTAKHYQQHSFHTSQGYLRNIDNQQGNVFHFIEVFDLFNRTPRSCIIILHFTSDYIT